MRRPLVRSSDSAIWSVLAVEDSVDDSRLEDEARKREHAPPGQLFDGDEGLAMSRKDPLLVGGVAGARSHGTQVLACCRSRWCGPLFHPLETFRITWDFFAMFILLYCLVETPFRLCFQVRRRR